MAIHLDQPAVTYTRAAVFRGPLNLPTKTGGRRAKTPCRRERKIWHYPAVDEGWANRDRGQLEGGNNEFYFYASCERDAVDRRWATMPTLMPRWREVNLRENKPGGARAAGPKCAPFPATRGRRPTVSLRPRRRT